ncbi:hypothetical protein ABQF35_14505 [Mycobacterium syngnathidarum]
MIAEWLRGAADFVDAVQQARVERRAGFSDREAGDYLDASRSFQESMVDAVHQAITDDGVDGEVRTDVTDEVTRLSLKLNRIRELANGWLKNGEHRGVPSQLLSILNEGTNFWVPTEADDVVDAEVHCEGCQCPAICGCGRTLYSEPESPDGPLFWFHRDDGSPITLDCARSPLAEPTDDELASQRGVLHVIPDPREVAQQDLAAHVAGSIRHFRIYRTGNFEDAADGIASELISEYRVTKR